MSGWFAAMSTASERSENAAPRAERLSGNRSASTGFDQSSQGRRRARHCKRLWKTQLHHLFGLPLAPQHPVPGLVLGVAHRERADADRRRAGQRHAVVHDADACDAGRRHRIHIGCALQLRGEPERLDRCHLQAGRCASQQHIGLDERGAHRCRVAAGQPVQGQAEALSTLDGCRFGHVDAVAARQADLRGGWDMSMVQMAACCSGRKPSCKASLFPAPRQAGCAAPTAPLRRVPVPQQGQSVSTRRIGCISGASRAVVSSGVCTASAVGLRQRGLSVSLQWFL